LIKTIGGDVDFSIHFPLSDDRCWKSWRTGRRSASGETKCGFSRPDPRPLDDDF
jgi:hypothetical protein